MTDTQKPNTDQEPINPSSTREQVRSWLQWLPAWFLIPLGLSQGQTNGTDSSATGNTGTSGHEGGYGGPNDAPGHIGSGYGDGASDLGGGLSGF